jgi:hypothetical protein
MKHSFASFPLPFRNSRDSGSVVDACVSFLRRSPWKSDSGFGSETVRVDRRIPYEGRLAEVAGSVTIVFRIVDATGVAVWGPEPHVVTPDAAGRFSTVVGVTELDADGDDVPDLDALDPAGLELELSVDDGSGRLLAMTPRQPLIAALHASTATSLPDGAVTGEMLAPDAVTTEKLSDGSVTSASVAPGALGAGQIAGGSVAGTQLARGAVTGAHLPNGTIDSSRLGPGSVNASHLAEGSVGGFELQDGSLGTYQISQNAYFRRRTCSWSGYLNEAGDYINASCQADHVMAGLYSTPSGNDRRFQILCCNVGP